MEFKEYPKITRLDKVQMHITQKIHGTNAAVCVYNVGTEEAPEWKVHAQSRTRIITPLSDNYGFAAFVSENAQEMIEKLGPGIHYGEWAGIGINSGEGLKEKIFVLFDHWRYPADRPLPPKTVVVPVLYSGELQLGKIEECLADLKANGSKLSPGFMRPEGIVITIGGARYKAVFEAEETGWKKSDKVKVVREDVNVDHLLQPIRLEKLISKDERYIKEYPKSLSTLAQDYLKDMLEEGQLEGQSENQVNSLKKKLYPWLKFMVNDKGYVSGREAT